MTESPSSAGTQGTWTLGHKSTLELQCSHSKIQRNRAKDRSIPILFRIAKVYWREKVPVRLNDHYFELNGLEAHLPTGCPQKIVRCLYVCFGGAMDSIIFVFTQLHRSGFNLEFETLFESV